MDRLARQEEANKVQAARNADHAAWERLRARSDTAGEERMRTAQALLKCADAKAAVKAWPAFEAARTADESLHRDLSVLTARLRAAANAEFAATRSWSGDS